MTEPTEIALGDPVEMSGPEEAKRPSRIRLLVSTVFAGILAFGRYLLRELSDPRDWHEYGGLALVSYGSWMLAPSAGLIVAGVGLVLISNRWFVRSWPKAPKE